MNRIWYEEGSEVPLSNKVFKSVPMVTWMRDTFEFDQHEKQAESLMHETGKISSNN